MEGAKAMRKLLLLVGISALFATGEGRPPDVPFRIEMIDPGASETAGVADINRDGHLDIVSGEYWYEGPTWKKHKFRDLDFTGNYIDNFADLPIDVNEDGYPDIVSVSWFAKKISWWKNPGKSGGAWTESVIDSGNPIEFAFLVDLTNSGRRQDVIPEWGSTNAPLTWYELKNGGFVRHVVSDHSYGHGIGVSDVNGDGRNDILTPKGWFEAPADPRTGEWKYHPDWDATAGTGFCGLQAAAPPARGASSPSATVTGGAGAATQTGGSPTRGDLAFIYALDINGDGRNDILTSCAHDYGIFWLEQGENGQWTKHNIDYTWSQAHSSQLADLRGDGRLDFIVGKRYMAHNGSDPGEREPLGIYWYEYRKTAQGGVEWIRHLIDYGGRMGAGIEMQVVDIDGDGDLDVVAGGKSGLFLARNLTRNPALPHSGATSAGHQPRTGP
jgi:hypothetical protein